MSPDNIVLLIFAVSVVLFVADILPMGLLVFSVPLALYFTGVIGAQEIFAPLVGQSIVLVVAMSVIGAALFKTGMAERIGRTLFRFAPGERSLIFLVMVFAGVVFGDVTPKVAGKSGKPSAAETAAAREQVEAVERDFAQKLTCPVYCGYAYGHEPVSHAIDFRRRVSVDESGVMTWEDRK